MSEAHRIIDISPSNRSVTPYSLAAGMLRTDIWFALLMVLLVCVTSFALGFVAPSDDGSLFLALVLERAIQLIAVVIIVRRWRKKLEISAGVSLPHAFVRTMVAGFALWGITLVPFILLSISDNQLLVFICATVLTFSAVLALRYYFYFATIGLFGGSAKEVALRTRTLTLKSPFAPIKAMSGPLGITALCMAVAFIPYPDGRSVLINSLAGSLEGLFTVLSTYTGLAFTLLMVDDTTWREAGLDYYRQERLETVSINTPKFSPNFLSGTTSVKVLILAAFIFSINISRQVSMPPAAEVKMVAVIAGDRRVHLELAVQDPSFKLVGFRAAAFSLAGEKGTPVSTRITAISINGQPSESVSLIPPTVEQVKISIDFETDRSANDLATLEDLHLWYYSSKLQPILPAQIRKDVTPPEPANGFSGDQKGEDTTPETGAVDRRTTI